MCALYTINTLALMFLVWTSSGIKQFPPPLHCLTLAVMSSVLLNRSFILQLSSYVLRCSRTFLSKQNRKSQNQLIDIPCRNLCLMLSFTRTVPQLKPVVVPTDWRVTHCFSIALHLKLSQPKQHTLIHKFTGGKDHPIIIYQAGKMEPNGMVQ